MSHAAGKCGKSPAATDHSKKLTATLGEASAAVPGSGENREQGIRREGFATVSGGMSAQRVAHLAWIQLQLPEEEIVVAGHLDAVGPSGLSREVRQVLGHQHVGPPGGRCGQHMPVLGMVRHHRNQILVTGHLASGKNAGHRQRPTTTPAARTAHRTRPNRQPRRPKTRPTRRNLARIRARCSNCTDEGFSAGAQLRPVKIQQKVSATWCTLHGLSDIAALRSCLATAAKHELDPVDAMRQLFTTGPWTPPAPAISS